MRNKTIHRYGLLLAIYVLYAPLCLPPESKMKDYIISANVNCLGYCLSLDCMIEVDGEMLNTCTISKTGELFCKHQTSLITNGIVYITYSEGGKCMKRSFTHSGTATEIKLKPFDVAQCEKKARQLSAIQ